MIYLVVKAHYYDLLACGIAVFALLLFGWVIRLFEWVKVKFSKKNGR